MLGDDLRSAVPLGLPLPIRWMALGVLLGCGGGGGAILAVEGETAGGAVEGISEANAGLS